MLHQCLRVELWQSHFRISRIRALRITTHNTTTKLRVPGSNTNIKPKASNSDIIMELRAIGSNTTKELRALNSDIIRELRALGSRTFAEIRAIDSMVKKNLNLISQARYKRTKVAALADCIVSTLFCIYYITAF
jgi:hypothetical protein